MGYNSAQSGDVRRLPLTHLTGTDHLDHPWHQICDSTGAIILNTWDKDFAEWLIKRANHFLPIPAECRDHKYYEFECQERGCQNLAMLEKYVNLSQAAAALVMKLDEVEPAIDSAFKMAFIHGSKYGGPSYGVELETLRREVFPAIPKPETFWEEGETAYPFPRTRA